MDKFQKVTLLLLRVALGWVMLYAGLTKIMNPEWTAAGYLGNAKSFQPFYAWLAQDGIIPIINFVNQWALFLLGVSLISGTFVRISSYLGALLMILYYLPGLSFPYHDNSFIVDSHIIYILLLISFAANKAGRIWGLDGWLLKQGKMFKKIC